MKILILGQLIGKSSITFLKEHLPKIKESYAVDATIAVADAVTGGFGLGKNHAFYLRKLGIDLLVGGESLFFKKDLVEDLSKMHFVVRPANFTGQGNFGYGSRQIRNGLKTPLTVINLMGNMGFHRIHAGNPYQTIIRMMEQIKEKNPLTIVTFSAIASAEKQTLGHLMAGQCSAVIGYGAKALTADAHIMKEHTAYITDIGRISAPYSIGGLDIETEIKRYQTQRPMRSIEANADSIEMQAVLVTINEVTGQAESILPIREIYPLKHPSQEVSP
ncbi:YmdB family metallophosphoesterase [Entomospira entomophila]|uniref:YmdB family metallophosphoesterase n=1 Tax=Entomospira entomophila TaxID=2719988 RepID=A0A968KS95_9SPIO|nr:YmdB family metallophosphoesterase [Entomospira entomophilus]NIZ40112.1 YmdB family metallophosphoesterase [Entomospira entomophilus]WDI35672.1 YmdB family metallophosphoesterase [Entomospira entomophilus]